MKQILVAARPDLIYGTRVQIHKDTSWYVFAVSSLGKDSVQLSRLKGICRIGIGTSIAEETVLEEVAE